MKLSIVVPVYNLENYIGECLTSLLEQQVNFDYQIIVCDDCSSDNSASIIKRFSEQYPNIIKAILKSKNAGLAENMRTLLSHVEGEYVAYLDGDDLALPSKLQKQVEYLDTHPSCSMVYHESDMFDSETGKSIQLYSSSFYNKKYIPAKANLSHLVRFGTFLQASSVMFRNHANLINTVPDFCKIILDYPFYIMNAGYLAGTIDFIEETLGRYRIHSQSFGAQTSRSVERRIQSLNDICCACEQAGQFGLSSEVIQQGISHHKYAAALYFLKKDNVEYFSQLISESVQHGYFFDERHQLAYQHRKQTKLVKKELKL